MSSIGKRLKYLRHDKGLKQTEAAEMIGVSKTNLSRYEGDKRIPNQETLKRLANFYGVSPGYLMFGESEKVDLDSLFNDITFEEAKLLKSYLIKIRNEKKKD